MTAAGLFIHKLKHWEYWPMKLMYAPVLPVWLYYSLRARSFFFFNAANPLIRNGGMAMESKKEIYELIPAEYIPATALVKAGTPGRDIPAVAARAGIRYPMIVKPDIGMKALGVETVDHPGGLLRYAERIGRDFLVQERVDAPREIGIFYVRHPDAERGRITGMVSKEFLSVTGNGADTVEALVRSRPRAFNQLSALRKMHGDALNRVLGKGERFTLVPYGSHTRGALFTDVTEMADENLNRTIDSICARIPGFHFGRLDILYHDIEELKAGKGFYIIEVNGAGSEPTHIYDPAHSPLFAWREITRHWRLLYEVSARNKAKGYPFLSWREGRAMLKANGELESFLKMV